MTRSFFWGVPRLAKKIECPECGESLRPEQVKGHLAYHWGLVCPEAEKFPEAARRYRALADLGKEEVV